jgi:hypothetical protein
MKKNEDGTYTTTLAELLHLCTAATNAGIALFQGQCTTADVQKALRCTIETMCDPEHEKAVEWFSQLPDEKKITAGAMMVRLAQRFDRGEIDLDKPPLVTIYRKSKEQQHQQTGRKWN